MKKLKFRLPLIIGLTLLPLKLQSQSTLALELGSNVLGYKSQFQEKDLYLRTMFKLNNRYNGNWQVGFGAKYSEVKNTKDNEDLVELIFYAGQTWEDIFTDKLDISLNGSFNLNSFTLILVTSLGLQLQASYEIYKGVSVVLNLDTVSHIERDSLYPDTLNRNFSKQNLSVYGGISIDLFNNIY